MSASTSVDYALDAAQLIDACCRRLAQLGSYYNEPSISDLAIVVASTERILHSHLLSLLKDAAGPADAFGAEKQRQLRQLITDVDGSVASSVMITAARLQVVYAERNLRQSEEQLHGQQSLCSQSSGMNGTASSAPYYPEYKQQISAYGKGSDSCQRKEGGINSLLFHLVTTLQMCLLRIEDADAVLSGDPDAARKRSESLVDELCAKEFVLSRDLFRGTHMHTKGSCYTNSSNSVNGDSNTKVLLHVNLPQQLPISENERKEMSTAIRGRIVCYGSIGLGCMIGMYTYGVGLETSQQKKLIHTAIKSTAAVFTTRFLKMKFLFLQVRARLLDSASILRVWQQKWILATSIVQQNNMRREVSYDRLIAEPSAEDHDRHLKAASRHLLECVPLQSNKVSKRGKLALHAHKPIKSLLWSGNTTNILNFGLKSREHFGILKVLFDFCLSVVRWTLYMHRSGQQLNIQGQKGVLACGCQSLLRQLLIMLLRVQTLHLRGLLKF